MMNFPFRERKSVTGGKVLGYMAKLAMGLILAAMLTGCSTRHWTREFYPGYSHEITISGQHQEWGGTQLVPSDGDTTFRLRVLDQPWPAMLIGDGRLLQFVIPSSDIVPGRSFAMPAVQAFSIGISYWPGAGYVSDGLVRIDSVEDARVTLTLTSEQLDARLPGTHTFRANADIRSKKTSSDLLTRKGFIRQPTPPEATAASAE